MEGKDIFYLILIFVLFIISLAASGLDKNSLDEICTTSGTYLYRASSGWICKDMSVNNNTASNTTFTNENFTTLYDARQDRYGNDNFTLQYDSRTDRFSNENATAILSDSNSSLWNISTNTYNVKLIYPKYSNSTVGFGVNLSSPVFIINVSPTNATSDTTHTGLELKPTSKGGGVQLKVLSPIANEGLTLTTKGTGTIVNSIGGTARYTVASNAHTFTVGAGTGAATRRFVFTGAADTTLTASTEAISVYFNLGQLRSHANGNIPTNRWFVIQAGTEGFTAGSAVPTINESATFTITGAPNATNARLAHSYGLWVQNNIMNFSVNNSYGAIIEAQRGAQNNYAAVFRGGYVGIRTQYPNYDLDVDGKINATSIILNDAINNDCETGEIRGNVTAEKICLCVTSGNWKCASVT